MSNLTNRPVIQKGQKRTRDNKPTQAQYARWEHIRALGCSVCGMAPEIHHIETMAGCKKNHDRVIPLCAIHHRSSSQGLHGMGRKAWEDVYGSEQEHLEKVVAIGY